MSSRVFTILILLLCTLGAYFKFNKNLQQIPIGCDEFGYLNLANAFSNNTTYDNHSYKPYMTQLLGAMRSKGFAEREFTWMVTPHAYYVIPNSNQIINQYAPATSYLLSYFPLAFRKQLFAAMAMFMILLFPLLALNSGFKKQVSWSHLFLLLLVFSFTLTAPLLTELTRINSVAPTVGLLLVAGYYLNKNTLISFLCIAITANFRVVNLLMLAPAVAFIKLPSIFNSIGFKTWINKALLHTSVVLLALIPYLWYVYKLRGNPFLSTYSSIDTNATTDFISNFYFYFNINDGWFQYNVLIIFVLCICAFFEKISLKKLLILLLFPIINYCFFLTHAIQINYYTYASAVILVGYLFAILYDVKATPMQQKYICLLCLFIAVFMLADGVFTYKKSNHVAFSEAQEKYKPLCNYNIIWGDLMPSGSEYVCQNNAFKFAAGSKNARRMAVEFLYRMGYSQVFLINDIPLPLHEITNELNSYRLPFKTDTLNNFGIVVYLTPQQISKP